MYRVAKKTTKRTSIIENEKKKEADRAYREYVNRYYPSNQASAMIKARKEQQKNAR